MQDTSWNIILYFQFGDSICIAFWDVVPKKKQTDRQTNGGENPNPAIAVVEGNRSVTCPMSTVRKVNLCNHVSSTYIGQYIVQC